MTSSQVVGPPQVHSALQLASSTIEAKQGCAFMIPSLTWMNEDHLDVLLPEDLIRAQSVAPQGKL